MKRLVYSPSVEVFIKSDYGIVDLSQYVTSCNVVRKVNQVSTATVTFRNPNMIFTEHLVEVDGEKIYEPMFHPMDPITIVMTRLNGYPVQVMTGYCDTTPYLQLFPGTATIEASCTLKRLLHRYWDPGLPFVWQFLTQNGWKVRPQMGGLINPVAEQKQTGTKRLNDSSIADLLYRILTEKDLGNWDKDSVVIEDLPSGIMERVTNLYDEFKTENEAAAKEFIDFMRTLLGSTTTGSDPTQGVTGSTNASGSYSYDDLFKLARSVGLSRPQANIAAAIALAESTGNPNAIGDTNLFPTGSRGLWQIYTKVHTQYDINRLFEPKYNAKAMYTISSGGTSWTPWSTFNNGDYLKYLKNESQWPTN